MSFVIFCLQDFSDSNKFAGLLDDDDGDDEEES